MDVEACGRWPGPEDGPLGVAAGLGDAAMMDLLLARGASARAATGPNGRTPLHVAAAGGRAGAVESLLGVGAPADPETAQGVTPACLAARGGHAETLRKLLDHGASLQRADSVDGSTPLHYAAQARDDGGAARTALAAGADAWARSAVMAPRRRQEEGEEEEEEPAREDLRGGLTPLMSAAATASLGPLRVLLAHFQDEEAAAYREARDIAGLTALGWAVAVPNGKTAVEAAEALVRAGARDDPPATADGRGLVHVAAAGANAHAVAWLVDRRGKSARARDRKRGWTPLHFAAAAGSKACVRALLRRGADPNAEARDGATPLAAAAAAAQRGAASLLLKRGADPLRPDRDGRFPSQAAPKTPQGKLLKWSLAKHERRAWAALEHEAKAARGKPPEPDAEEREADALIQQQDILHDDSEDDPDDVMVEEISSIDREPDGGAGRARAAGEL